jgi:glucose-6-phosphate dehydrogenase assembly protein OpcA
MTDMTDLPLAKQFRQVALGEIENTLDVLWRDVTEAARAAGGNPVSRNTVLTLVAYTADPEHARIALATVEDLTNQHPSRAIVLVTEPERQGALVDAHVAIHSEGSGPSVAYGEEIVIEALGDAARHVPGVVLPLMVSGLPAFLWWLGEPPWGSALIETLVDGCDRLIVDSCDATDVDRTLIATADLVRRKHERCALSDFNWTRQRPWHELTAQFFDAPDLRPYLAGIDHVTVEYAAGDEDAPTNSAQAYLYVGWLASRLGWALPSAHRHVFGPSRQHTLHDGNGRPVLVEVNARFGVHTSSWCEIDQPAQRAGRGSDLPAHDGSDDLSSRTGRGAALPHPAQGKGDGGVGQGDGEIGPAHDQRSGLSGEPQGIIGHGALMSVRIHALHDRRPGTFIIARDQDLAHATTLSQVEGDTATLPSHTVHLGSLGEIALLHGQLEMLGHDTIYEAALATAARLVGYDARR